MAGLIHKSGTELDGLYLQLLGGTMSGDINMNGNDILNDVGGRVVVGRDSNDPEGNLAIGRANAGQVIFSIGGDGGSNTTGRRYIWKRSASFGQLEFYAVNSVGTESLMMYFNDGGTVWIPPVYNVASGASNDVHVDTNGQLYRSTSARKYKTEERDAPELADIVLNPVHFFRPDTERYYYGQVADDLADQDPLLGVYNDDGDVEAYDKDAVMAVLIAKVNRLENE